MWKKDIPAIHTSEDGSPTLFSVAFNEHYHSLHGAVDESNAVFIQPGLLNVAQQTGDIFILEMGFGSGLNAWLTYVQAKLLDVKIFYHTIEKFPIDIITVRKFYEALCIFCPEEWKRFLPAFLSIYECDWSQNNKIAENFTIIKDNSDFCTLILEEEKYNLIYFDAFSPNVQPELWDKSIFEKIYAACQQNAVMMTYCCKGDVRRAMKSAGFNVEKIPGPKGKREITQAVKNNKTK